MTSLPVCRWRVEAHQGRYLCHSAKFLGAPNLVTAEYCAKCTYVDHPPTTPVLPALPCVHLGVSRATMGPAVFDCSLHGSCVPARLGLKLPNGPRPCNHCPDYLPRAPFGPSSAEMLRRVEELLASMPAYPADQYQGRGVVVAGGGERYFPSLYVAVRALRHVGCRLPIQVWYLGRADEMPQDRQALLAPYNVDCIDADAVRRQHPARRLDGWELKVFATLHSPFEEVLFLDADCYPCRNPDFLFDLVDYRTNGAIFWPDMLTTDTRLKWAAFAVSDPCRPGSVESGQYVIHKGLSWRPLNLAWFYNNHSDYYYHYCYGDKHTFEVAWARCKQPFVMWQPNARWDRVAYLHPGPDNETMFVHRCADKFRFDSQNYVTRQQHPTQFFCPTLPLENECWSWMADLALLLGRAPNTPLIAEMRDGTTDAVPLA